MFENRTQQLVEILQGVEMPPEGAVPGAAIKSMRGKRSQAEVALKSGLTQAQISRLESGARSLSPETAKQLAPALGTTAADLLAAERVGRLHGAALKGALDPRALLSAIEELAWTLPDEEVCEDLVDSLLGVLKRAIETYEPGAASVATKSAGETRDHLGRRKAKPFGVKEGEEQAPTVATKAADEPTRDSVGRRIEKPHAPRRGGRA